MENDEQVVSLEPVDGALKSERELALDDPESRITDSDWVEQEPTPLEKINWFKKRPPKQKWKHQLEELRRLIEALGARIDQIELHIPGLDLDRGVVTWNTRWGHVVFNASDLASVDGATRTWVESILPSIGNVIDGGIY